MTVRVPPLLVQPFNPAAEMPPGQASALADLNDRSREIFRRIVEGYLATGEPVGSRNLVGS